MAQERLQKLIAQAGIASRRKAEQLIVDGHVSVNGVTVTTLGTTADLKHDVIAVDGQKIELPKSWAYYVLNKPAGVVTTAKDEFDRQTVLDLVQVPERVFPVGRLDFDAEGLLLLTNDGDLSVALTHPAGGVQKTYIAKVQGIPTPQELDKLRDGVILEDGLAVVQSIEICDKAGPKTSDHNAWVEVCVSEGRNHLVKRLLESIGHKVIRLRRIEFANLVLDRGLPAGKFRALTEEEIRVVKTVAKRAKALRDGTADPQDTAQGRKGRR